MPRSPRLGDDLRLLRLQSEHAIGNSHVQAFNDPIDLLSGDHFRLGGKPCLQQCTVRLYPV
jgi:hypothetical protein